MEGLHMCDESNAFIVLQDEVITANREALGIGWTGGRELSELHAEGLLSISRAAGEQPGSSDQAVLLLGAHAWNLFSAGMEDLLRGRFDVVAYLLRPLADSGQLLVATGLDEDLAVRFLGEGELKASEARRHMVKILSDLGETDLANDVDRVYRDDHNALNQLAHPGPVQLDKLLERRGDSVVPVLGGRPDPRQSIRLARGLVLGEVLALANLWSCRHNYLGRSWGQRLHDLHDALSGWLKDTD